MSGRSLRELRKPRNDDSRLRDALNSVLSGWVLLVAHDLKLFDALAASPKAIDSIAAALGIALRPAQVLLSVCELHGFVTQRNSEYSLTPVAREYLLKDSPTYAGGILDYLFIANQNLYSFDSVKKAILTDAPQVYGGGDIWESHEAAAERARGFTRGMHSSSIGAALAWPSKVDLSGCRTMLDVAGGSGAHSIGALRRWPRLRSIVLEIPPVCEVTREFAEAYGLSDRIVAQPADMWNDPFPPADLHFYSQIFHDWPPERCRVLARKSFDALRPGGRIIIHEMLLNQRKAGPPGVVGRNVAMLLWVQGQEFSARELSQILKDTGFVSIKSKHTFGHWGIVTGVKPR